MYKQQNKTMSQRSTCVATRSAAVLVKATSLTVALALMLLLGDTALSFGQGSGFPGCPAWNHTLTFVNNCTDTVTITETDGCFSNKSSEPPFNGNKCWPQQTPGGKFSLAPDSSKIVSVMSCWSGNFSVGCSTCSTAVETLGEFTFDGGLANTNPPSKLPGLLDTYDISLVNGFTKTFYIAPETTNNPSGGGTCDPAGCQSLPTCPEKLQDGDACLSPNMYAIQQNFPESEKEKYGCVCSTTTSTSCIFDSNNPTKVPDGCVGKYGCSPFSPPGNSNPGSACCPWYNVKDASCNATSEDRAWASWAQDYISNVHDNCPGEYAWQYDDKHGTFTCQGKNTAMNYTITVCPSNAPD